MIKLAHVNLNDRAKAMVRACTLENKIGQTEVIEGFESAMAKYLDVRYCLAVSNGTMADTIALAALKARYPEKDEVIIPALTFIAHANSIYYNHLKPVFVDVGQDFQIGYDIEDKITDKTLCIFPVHLLGQPFDIQFMLEITRKHSIPFIEDTCEALGTTIHFGKKQKHCGTFGYMGTYSFFPSHTITTGEGGMIAMGSEELYSIAKKLRNHGRNSSQDFHFDQIGFNGKMTSIEAAMGLCQVDEIENVVEKRLARYQFFGGSEKTGQRISPHGFPYICKSKEERDFYLQTFRDEGIECRNLFSSIPTQEKAYAYLGHKLGDFPNAEWFGDRGMYVPCHQSLNEYEVNKIKGVFNGLQEKTKKEVEVTA